MKIRELLESVTFTTSISVAKRLAISNGNSNAKFMIASALNEEGSKKIIAIEKNKIVGAVSYYHDKDKVTIIEWIGSISPGVGSQLLKKVEDEARKKKQLKINAWSTKDADDFYNKHGFKLGSSEGHFSKSLTESIFLESTKHLDISITGDWKQRIFVTAKLKDHAKSWLDDNSIVVEATYDIIDHGRCLYRNYIITHKRGKSLAREVHEYVFQQAKKHNIIRTEGYIERDNFDAQSMVKKLGMKELRHAKDGSYWGKDL